MDLRGVYLCVPLYSIAFLLLGASVTAGIIIIQVAVAPLLFRYSKTFRRNLIFANAVQWPPNVNFEDPSASGVEGGRNFTIEYESKVDGCPIKIGVWHILPKSVYERLKGSFEADVDKEQLYKLMDNELASSRSPVIMYCHGNSNSRAASHRVLIYKFFQQMDFHTIAFDYRGYGDSTNVRPSEAGVVEDSLAVYDWMHTTLAQGKHRPPVFVWGHSLGTGISSHLLGNLAELSKSLLGRAESLPPPNGLILEAPFNNLADEVANHPLAILVAWLPHFEASFVAPFRASRAHAFRSDAHLARAAALPALLLHARDDLVVPYAVGDKLYKAIVASRKEGDAVVKLHAYDAKEKLGHKYICKAADLADVVGEFIQSHQ